MTTILDVIHAKAALRYSARADTAGSYRTVAARVHKRYPSLAKG